MVDVCGVDPGPVVVSVGGKHGQTVGPLQVVGVSGKRKEVPVRDGVHDGSEVACGVPVAALHPEMASIDHLGHHHLQLSTAGQLHLCAWCLCICERAL